MTNPLLQAWDTPFGIAPYDRISDQDFSPALDRALVEARKNIANIAENKEPPTFANTIEALELADEKLKRVLSVFFNLSGSDSNAERDALQREFAPILSAYSSELSMNSAIFDRIDALWSNQSSLGLLDEQARLLKLYRRNFVRSGALLTGDKKDRLKDVLSRLAVLGTLFTQNLLADEKAWSMKLSAKDLSELPDFVAAAATAAGTERGAVGPVVTLSRSLIVPFLQFCPNRSLRKTAYKAWAALGANDGENDNRAIVAEVLALRQERASLLGYDSFAAFKLETEMAKTPQAVRELLTQIWQPACQQAIIDAARLEERMKADGHNGELEPWDWRYYSEQRRREEHALDESELKPHFQLDNMLNAVFDCANRLFALDFKEIDVPLYHPDARAWEVQRNGKHIALFVGDYFARGSKRSGAWCSALQSQKKLGGETKAIVVNTCNFSKPDAGQPALLSFDDARTLFHEFGHALHQMLSDVTYDAISGTSVARDFVELPSQLFEHWLEVPEVLKKHALHADSSEPISDMLLDRLLAAQTYDMGYQTVEYLASAFVDLAFHDGAPPTDPMQTQKQILADLGLPHAIEMRHRTPQFAHVFSGDGYSSAYYSYIWSEVMDADAFDAFLEAGDPFNAKLAEKLERHILSKGGSKEPEELYKLFRGRMPGVAALLKGRGLDNVA